MTEKPSFYERTERLLQDHYATSLQDFDITTDRQLKTQWPPAHYTPAEVVIHYVEKHNLKCNWE